MSNSKKRKEESPVKISEKKKMRDLRCRVVRLPLNCHLEEASRIDPQREEQLPLPWLNNANHLLELQGIGESI